ncbi:S41 family peptidase [Chloroflexota bacterium]
MVIGFFMAVLGFGAGFATHAVVVAGEPSVAPISIAEVTAPPPLVEEEPDSLDPTPAPTIAIPSATGEEFDLFWEAWDLIQRDYYGDLPTEDEMTYGAIRGALNTLEDPFTGFIEPDVAEINREDDTGSFEGIGAYVTMRDGRLLIVNTFKAQPAEQAGLRRGDIVLQVDETPIENMSIYEAITLIRGEAGTAVLLSVLREGEEPFEVEIVRAQIDIPVVESEMREDGVGYVSLFDFSSDASVKLAEAIKELQAQDPKGLILDMLAQRGGANGGSFPAP